VGGRAGRASPGAGGRGLRRRGCRDTTTRAADRWSDIAIAGSLVAFGGLSAAVRAGRTTAADTAITRRLQAVRSPGFARMMAAASWPGFPPQSRILPILAIGGWAAGGQPVDAVVQGVAWGSAAAASVVKAIVRRPRPVGPTVRVAPAPLAGTSFPSGHVLTYTAFYGFLAHSLCRQTGRRPARRIAVGSIAGLVLLVGPSRIQRGHHWPSDVLASYLLGFAYLLAVIRLRRHLERSDRG
jgi:membrane-associated phospholipid phosphatase